MLPAASRLFQEPRGACRIKSDHVAFQSLSRPGSISRPASFSAVATPHCFWTLTVLPIQLFSSPRLHPLPVVLTTLFLLLEILFDLPFPHPEWLVHPCAVPPVLSTVHGTLFCPVPFLGLSSRLFCDCHTGGDCLSSCFTHYA